MRIYPTTKSLVKIQSIRQLSSLNRNRNGNDSTKAKLKTPDLIYVPQILRWLKTKIGFRILRKTWDPDFSEGGFIYGSTQAICRITDVISKNDEDDILKRLVTPALRRRLTLEMNVHLTELQRRIIKLEPEDVKLLIPLEVRLKHMRERRICFVNLRALGVKWHQIKSANRLVIIALQTEFIRDYTDSVNPTSEWTVNTFDILECGIAGEAHASK